MALLSLIKKRGGLTVAVVSLITYIIMVCTYLVFVTTTLLLGLIIVIPLLVLGVLKKDKKILARRAKASCWALGFLILLLFPTFWLIPQQVYVRVNRQDTLITPDDPAVEDLAEKFLKEHDDYDNMSFKEKGKAVSKFVTDEIQWVLDYETYGMSGHVATPAQCIELGKDDCQGQAVTLASVLLALEFKYVWVVETPFHWYVLVRDPDKEKLEKGWETQVEEYQENGEVLPLNRDGQGSMPDWRLEEVVLIFNDKETLYPVNPLEALFYGWSATAFFYDDIFPIFYTYEIIFLIAGMFLLAFPFSVWTYYMTKYSDKQRDYYRKNAKKILVKRMLVLGPLLFAVFLIWFLIQTILWDYTLIISISEIAFIAVLSSEAKFWEFLRI